MRHDGAAAEWRPPRAHPPRPGPSLTKPARLRAARSCEARSDLVRRGADDRRRARPGTSTASASFPSSRRRAFASRAATSISLGDARRPDRRGSWRPGMAARVASRAARPRRRCSGRPTRSGWEMRKTPRRASSRATGSAGSRQDLAGSLKVFLNPRAKLTVVSACRSRPISSASCRVRSAGSRRDARGRTRADHRRPQLHALLPGSPRRRGLRSLRQRPRSGVWRDRDRARAAEPLRRDDSRDRGARGRPSRSAPTTARLAAGSPPTCGRPGPPIRFRTS